MEDSVKLQTQSWPFPLLSELVLAIIWLMPPADIYHFFWEKAVLTSVSLRRCFKKLVGWNNFFLITDILQLLRRAHRGLSQERVGAGQERENTSLLCSHASPEFPFSLPFLCRHRVPTSTASLSMRAFSDLFSVLTLPVRLVLVCMD